MSAGELAELVIDQMMARFKEEDLVIVPREKAEAERLRERCLRKKSLTYKEISDAQIWGSIGKTRVEAIAKGELSSEDLFKKGNAFRIHMHAVKRIALNRGTW